MITPPDPALNYTNQPPDDLGCNATDPANSISQRATKNSTCPSMTQPQNQSNNKQENQISFSGSSSLSSSDNSPISTSQANQSPPPKRYCSSSASIGGRGLDQSRELPVRQMAGSLMPGTAAYFPPLTQCLECEVKDAEIQALRKRIQVNQDHLAMLLSSTENSDNKRRTGTSGTESDSSSSSPAPGSQVQKYSGKNIVFQRSAHVHCIYQVYVCDYLVWVMTKACLLSCCLEPQLGT